MFRALFLTCLFALPAHAQDILTGPEFDALTQGRTFTYSVDGNTYGIERYLPNHVVEWSYLDGQCQTGTWHIMGAAICFQYENPSNAECWHFRLNIDGTPGMNALHVVPPGEDRLYQMRETPDPIMCLGPKTGV